MLLIDALRYARFVWRNRHARSRLRAAYVRAGRNLRDEICLPYVLINWSAFRSHETWLRR